MLQSVDKGGLLRSGYAHLLPPPLLDFAPSGPLSSPCWPQSISGLLGQRMATFRGFIWSWSKSLSRISAAKIGPVIVSCSPGGTPHEFSISGGLLITFQRVLDAGERVSEI